MVILIGGVSCSGKTVMAQRLLEKYLIPYLSIDHIKMGLFRGSRYCDFSPEDDEDALTDKLWPVVKGIIMTNIENGQHIIIEGCYLPPERIRDFEQHYLNQIIALYIGFSENYIMKHYASGIIEHRSDIEQKECDDYINRQNLIKLHSKTRDRCIANHVKYFEIDENYSEEMKPAYRWIDEQIQSIRQS